MHLSDYVGIPFTEKGSVRTGANCWGLARLVYAEKLGIILPGHEELYADTKDETLPALIERESRRLFRAVGKEQSLDLILLRIKGLPWHVGVVGEPGKMLHVERGTDSIYESYRGKKWEKRILGFYRHTSLFPA